MDNVVFYSDMSVLRMLPLLTPREIETGGGTTCCHEFRAVSGRRPMKGVEFGLKLDGNWNSDVGLGLHWRMLSMEVTTWNSKRGIENESALQKRSVMLIILIFRRSYP